MVLYLSASFPACRTAPIPADEPVVLWARTVLKAAGLGGSVRSRVIGNTEFREAALDFNEDEMDRLAAAAGLHSFQVELQFYGSERTTLANWEYAQELVAREVPDARFTDGESLPVPLTREKIYETTGQNDAENK